MVHLFPCLHAFRDAAHKVSLPPAWAHRRHRRHPTASAQAAVFPLQACAFRASPLTSLLFPTHSPSSKPPSLHFFGCMRGTNVQFSVSSHLTKIRKCLLLPPYHPHNLAFASSSNSSLSSSSKHPDHEPLDARSKLSSTTRCADCQYASRLQPLRPCSSFAGRLG